MKTTKLLIIISVLLLWTPHAFAEESILIGILNQPQSCGEKKEVSARILFHKDGTKWKALGVSGQSKPSTQWDVNSIEWTVTSGGKNLGKAYVLEPADKKYINDSFYRRDKLHGIKPSSTIPNIINKPKSFFGWCSAPDFRPTVIVSKPYFKDPEEWKPFKPIASHKEMLFPFLKVSIGRGNSKQCEYKPTYHSVPYDFKPIETVIYESYRSSTNKELISIGLDNKKTNCDGPLPAEWSGNWFLINKQEVDFIGREMELIDSGDYDGDGKSEFLFWHSGYNQDGYILIYNDFRESAEYLWSYH